MTWPRRVRGAAAGALAAALLLAGCADADEAARREVLHDVVAATVDQTLAFTLTLDAPEEALAGFEESAGPLAGLLAETSAAGVVEGDRVALGVQLGGVDVLQARLTGPGEQFVRFDLGALAELAGDPEQDIGRRLDAALAAEGLDRDARAAVLAAARGGWVRLVPDDGAAPTAAGSVGAALGELLRTAEPVGHVGVLDRQPFDGQLDVEVDLARAVAAAAAALAGAAPAAADVDAPARTLPGRLQVDDGVVRSLVLELGALAEGTDEVELHLDLRPLPADEQLVRAPEVAAEVTTAQLRTAVAAIEGLTAPDAP